MEKGFSAIAGLEEIKEEIGEIADFMVNSQKYKRFGAKIPKGVLLYGPPGTGKTMLAKALAYETGSNYIYASGSEFIEKFVGVGANRVRTLFEKAEKKSPCIIFIDEIDAIGVSRNTDNNSERDQTLNQLLIEMDGFRQKDGVVVLAATNRIDMLDKALVRPGRFDRHIYVGNPGIDAREKIVELNLKNKPVDKNVDPMKIACRTGGLSGAHIANMINEAALMSVRKGKKSIGEEEIDEAIIKTTAGVKNTNVVVSDKEKGIVAFHEAGHALAGYVLQNKIPEVITIIPHGTALGFVLEAEETDRFLMTKEEITDQICVLLAGRAAEEITTGKITNGAQNDLEKANKLAEGSICSYGMSRKYKNRVFGSGSEKYFMKDLNEEVTELLDDCYKKTAELLKNNIDVLRKLADVLYKNEIVKRNELQKFFSSVLFPQEIC